jgi:hypothetical protein
MGSAWYPRAQVLSLRDALAAPPPLVPAVAVPGNHIRLRRAGRNAQLIAHLRNRARAVDGSAVRGPAPRSIWWPTPASASRAPSASIGSGWRMTRTRSPAKRAAAPRPASTRAAPGSAIRNGGATRRIERDTHAAADARRRSRRARRGVREVARPPLTL